MGGNSEDPMAAMAALTQANNVQAVTPPWLQGVGEQTMPQAMPGQLEAIAAQLAGGYGGKPADFMKHLDQVYDPVRSMNFAPPKPGAKPVAKPVAPAAVAPKPAAKKPLQYGTGQWLGDGTQIMSNRPLGRNTR